MDRNKLKVLQEIGYQVRRTCANCRHGVFREKTEWGTCAVWTYSHEKHNDSVRQLSINRNGFCDQKWQSGSPMDETWLPLTEWEEK